MESSSNPPLKRNAPRENPRRDAQTQRARHGASA